MPLSVSAAQLAMCMEALSEVTLYFCGSCGCYDRTQEHAQDCVEADRTPRARVVYVPMVPQR